MQRSRSSEAHRLQAHGRVESVLRLLPTDGTEVTASYLVRRLGRPPYSLPRRTALRRLKEAVDWRPAGPFPILQTRRSGRNRLYSFAMTGFMNSALAGTLVHSSSTGFLREARSLAPRYGESEDSMRLFWEQASSALVLSIDQVIEAAQSVLFGQIHPRAMPSESVARRQAKVLVDTFIEKWTTDLIATFHYFLQLEQHRNWPEREVKPKRGAPSAKAAYRDGWRPIRELAAKTWVDSRVKGGWAEFLLEAEARELEHLRGLAREGADASGSFPSS